jgi:hypothetical protein
MVEEERINRLVITQLGLELELALELTSLPLLFFSLSSKSPPTPTHPQLR